MTKTLPKIEEIIPEEVDTRRIYNLVVSFNSPSQATISLAANDKDHAINLAMEQIEQAGWTLGKIHDVYLLEDIYKRDRDIMEKMKSMQESQVIDVKAKEILN